VVSDYFEGIKTPVGCSLSKKNIILRPLKGITNIIQKEQTYPMELLKKD
jgi:hypothetical protein